VRGKGEGERGRRKERKGDWRGSEGKGKGSQDRQTDKQAILRNPQKSLGIV
jgi:hypothetical protein